MASDTFKKWLSAELDSHEIDASVFVDYITGILENEEEDEWKEALVEILNESIENDDNCFSLCNDIMSRWKENETNPEAENEQGESNLSDDKIKSIIAMQQMTISKHAKSKVLNPVKDSVVAAYSQLSDEGELYDDDSDDVNSSKKSSHCGIARNVNSSSVDEEVRRKREQSKKLSDEKKVNDKINRENQKKKKQDRQEKEKQRTQKGERRR